MNGNKGGVIGPIIFGTPRAPKVLFPFGPHNTRNGQHTGEREEKKAAHELTNCTKLGRRNAAERLSGCGAWLAEGLKTTYDIVDIMSSKGRRTPEKRNDLSILARMAIVRAPTGLWWNQ
jgi:hypothetical protein